MTDIQTTKEYYVDLLLYQYNNLPKAKATIDLLVGAILVDLLPKDIETAFDLETAIGSQLDIIGEYIGLNRVINATITRDYFTFEDEQNNAAELFGFTNYTDPLLNAEVVLNAYIDASRITSALNDSEYRILLKLKSIINRSNNSMYEISDILYGFFGTDIILYDQLDMSLFYFVKSTISKIILIAASQNILPKPMGVEISIFSLDDPSLAWGFNDYQSAALYEIGFSDYSTGYSNARFLNYNDRV
jgi:hypothetical protein